MSDHRTSFFAVYGPLLDTIRNEVIAALERNSVNARTDDDSRQMLMASVLAVTDVLVLQTVAVDLGTDVMLDIVRRRFAELRSTFEELLLEEAFNVN